MFLLLVCEWNGFSWGVGRVGQQFDWSLEWQVENTQLKPSILQSSDIDAGFSVNFDDIVITFFGPVVQPAADMILQK